MRIFSLILMFALLPFKGIAMPFGEDVRPILLKDDGRIVTPIKRSPLKFPIIGIEHTTIVRLQEASASTYNVEIYQDGVLVFSSFWNFQVEELELPSDLRGNLKIVMSIGKNRFVGSFSID